MSASSQHPEVSRLCLGGNVFGWTVDAAAAPGILDAFVDGGGTFIDTADQYVDWVPGARGGESETIIGDWMASRNHRDRVVIGTKAGKGPDARGLSAGAIRTALENSLRRLRTDYIDVYYAHEDDPETPLAETAETFDALIREGKIRYAAVSNYSADRLQARVDASDAGGWARPAILQPHYNLVRRSSYEGALADVCARNGIGCVPYFSLASGFLTGKYRGGTANSGPRAGAARRYLDDRGTRILASLDDVAAEHSAPVAAVALAWLTAQPTVVSAVASGTSVEQVDQLLISQRLDLTRADLDALDAASEPDRVNT